MSKTWITSDALYGVSISYYFQTKVVSSFLAVSRVSWVRKYVCVKASSKRTRTSLRSVLSLEASKYHGINWCSVCIPCALIPMFVSTYWKRVQSRGHFQWWVWCEGWVASRMAEYSMYCCCFRSYFVVCGVVLVMGWFVCVSVFYCMYFLRVFLCFCVFVFCVFDRVRVFGSLCLVDARARSRQLGRVVKALAC